jgi:hypothetical protein
VDASPVKDKCAIRPDWFKNFYGCVPEKYAQPEGKPVWGDNNAAQNYSHNYVNFSFVAEQRSRFTLSGIERRSSRLG